MQDASALKYFTRLTSVWIDKLQKSAISRRTIGVTNCQNYHRQTAEQSWWSLGQSWWSKVMCTWRGFIVSLDAHNHLFILSSSNGRSRRALLRQGLWFRGVIIGRRTRATDTRRASIIAMATGQSGMPTAAGERTFKMQCAKYHQQSHLCRGIKKLAIQKCVSVQDFSHICTVRIKTT